MENMILTLQIVLFKGIAENTSEYCKKGDIVGVKDDFKPILLKGKMELRNLD